MIESLLSPVRIFSRSSLQATELMNIITNLLGTQNSFTVGIVSDNAPIQAKDLLLKELGDLVECHLFDRVQPNPQSHDIMTMYQDERFGRCDVLVSIGGGSVLDSAKALAMLATNKGDLDGYLGANPIHTVTKAAMPLVLIPTTAGTGSEVTKVGVYTDQTGRKHTLGSPLMHAAVAILDAAMLDTIPPALCAATGLDALDHALESIWSKNATAITRTVARQAAVEVLTTLPQLYQAIVDKKSNRRPLQEAMLVASAKAGIAFNLTGTAAGHAISFILSEEWDVPHGMGCAFTLLEIFDWAQNDAEVRSNLALIGKTLHPDLTNEKDQVTALRSTIATMMKELSIPTRFSDIGVELDDVARFDRSMEDPKLHNQLPPISKKELYAIIEAKR